MDRAPREKPLDSHPAPAPALTDNVFRLAIHQRHDLADVGEVLDKVAVEFGQAKGATTVYVFAVRRRGGAGRAFAWAEDVSQTTTVIHTALESPATPDAARAVRSRIPPARRSSGGRPR